MNLENNASSKEFLILTKYKDFMNILDKIIENIPKKDYFYKNKLKELSIELLYSINKTNNEDNYIAGALVVKCKDKISILVSGYDKKYQSFSPNYFLFYKKIRKQNIVTNDVKKKNNLELGVII